MSSTPYLKSNESTEPIYTLLKGGSIVLVIGKTAEAKELTKIYEFSNPAEAVVTGDTGLGPEAPTNYLLAGVLSIFEESKKRNASDTLGVEKVYAINVGPSPTTQDWLDAAETGELKKDVMEEVYLGVSEIALMNSIKTRIDTLAGVGQYRIVGFTVADGASVTDIIKMTDTTELTSIRSSRIYLKDNPAMQSTFAGKIAHTEFYLDPSFEEYRSKTVDDIGDSFRSQPDIDNLVDAGIIPDWERIGYPGQAEPVRAVSTAWRLVGGSRPVDANLHIRRSVDNIWRNIDTIVLRNLKALDVISNLEAIRESGNAYLNTLKRDGKIQDYSFDVQPHPSIVEAIIIKRKVQPQNSIYYIEEDSVIQAPQ